MEIKVGEYVRTEFGNIGKFYRPASESSDVYYIYINKDGNKISSRYDSIVKHSSNIIDIIEVGDYVNGYKVLDTMEDMQTGEIHLEMPTDYTNEELGDCTIYNKDIKSIVTKQQMEAIQYVVE